VLRRHLEDRIPSGNPVCTKTRRHCQPIEWMPTILDIPGVVVGDDIAAQQTALIHRLGMECCVALTGIVGIIQDNILLNQRSVVGIKSRGLAALVWLEIEARLNLVRPPHAFGTKYVRSPVIVDLLAGFKDIEERLFSVTRDEP
jgi:hypothetical protein